MQILTEFIEVEFPGGTKVSDAISDAKSLAIKIGIGVKFSFNSVTIRISSDTDYLTREIADMYLKELSREKRVDV